MENNSTGQDRLWWYSKLNNCAIDHIIESFARYCFKDQPKDIRAYTTKAICADLAALLDLLGVRRVILVGHDWGAETVWRFCLWHPQRVRAVIA
jgi:soluble epoxide hydrolase/lipid-phosphate phosphatase